MPFRTTTLGKNGPEVCALGLGLMGLSAFYGEVPSDEERFEFLDRACDLGETFWDSADIYGDNEDLIGKWFKRTGKRNEIFLASKFAANMETGEVRTDAEYVRIAINKSLKRLGVKMIDLYYVHRVDLKTPIEETVEAMAELVKEGKIKHLGLSEVSAKTLRRAHAVHPISAIQVEYGPFQTDIEKPDIDLMNTAKELGVAVIAYSPLGRGMLTGKYSSLEAFAEGDVRKMLYPQFTEHFQHNLDLANKLIALAKQKGCEPSQLALAWIMARGTALGVNIIPIPGTKKIKYLEENMGALQVEITKEESAEIDKLAADVKGAREVAGFEAYTYADTPELK